MEDLERAAGAGADQEEAGRGGGHLELRGEPDPEDQQSLRKEQRQTGQANEQADVPRD